MDFQEIEVLGISVDVNKWKYAYLQLLSMHHLNFLLEEIKDGLDR